MVTKAAPSHAGKTAGVASSESADQETQNLLVAGANLSPPLLSALLSPHTPLSSTTATCPTAVLSFDTPGIPYYEPVYSGVIVKGLNDQPGRQLSLKATGGQDAEGVDFQRWLWERCTPGTAFEGGQVPPLEGVVFKLSSTAFNTVRQRIEAEGKTLVRVECELYAGGDPDVTLGKATAYYRRTLLSIFSFHNPTHLQSRQFLSHFLLIKPYSPTFLQKWAGRMIAISLVPMWIVGTVARSLGVRERGWTRAWVERLRGVLSGRLY
ncbi:butirosin biosynthesis, BtrG-like protein [Pseudohyphozyma bogoriensis]|nr:butirosin biosynthesis, BtrG-like protein [Pseudohyphozyma bogoriensis]